jgi:hypothetical protein
MGMHQSVRAAGAALSKFRKLGESLGAHCSCRQIRTSSMIDFAPNLRIVRERRFFTVRSQHEKAAAICLFGLPSRTAAMNAPSAIGIPHAGVFARRTFGPGTMQDSRSRSPEMPAWTLALFGQRRREWVNFSLALDPYRLCARRWPNVITSAARFCALAYRWSLQLKFSRAPKPHRKRVSCHHAGARPSGSTNKPRQVLRYGSAPCRMRTPAC